MKFSFFAFLSMTLLLGCSHPEKKRSVASTDGEEDRCFTKNTEILYRCEGKNLSFVQNGKSYRKINYHVSICRDVNKNLLMEVFPFAAITDHASEKDYHRPTVRAAVKGENSFEGHDIYRPDKKSPPSYQAHFSIVSNDFENDAFKAMFYDGTAYSSNISGEVSCVKY